MTTEQIVTAETQIAAQIANENVRSEQQIVAENKRAKLEALRMARETLTENNRNLPAGDRGISAADITTFAAALMVYVNAS